MSFLVGECVCHVLASAFKKHEHYQWNQLRDSAVLPEQKSQTLGVNVVTLTQKSQIL